MLAVPFVMKVFTGTNATVNIHMIWILDLNPTRNENFGYVAPAKL